MDWPPPRLNLPPFEVRLRPRAQGKYEIYDPLRRRWVTLTPEEWVRQHFTHYLAARLGYPPAMMGNERSIRVGADRPRRCDTVVYDSALRPVAVCEYKAPSVAVTQRTFDQIARYNTTLRVPVLIVSNGLRHWACRVAADGTYSYLEAVPAYAELLAYRQ